MLLTAVIFSSYGENRCDIICNRPSYTLGDSMSEIKKKTGRNIWRLTICGIEDLKKKIQSKFYLIVLFLTNIKWA